MSLIIITQSCQLMWAEYKNFMTPPCVLRRALSLILYHTACWAMTCHFNSLCAVTYGLNLMSKGTREQILRKSSVVWLGVNTAPSRACLNKSICFCFLSSWTCTCRIYFNLICYSLSVSFSRGQIACFPSSEGEKLLNMEEEEWNWHQHDIPLTQASLKSPFSPPLLLLPSLPLPHVKHMVGGCL